ncbi:MAG: hypothetical protein QOE70_5371 [Chthoniobacter sp.]|jgi:hypothetical protein|nr:hypothetical protein [Chthoniobacter sp.]
MKTTRSIEVTVQPTGEIAIEAVAFKGADCEQATKYLEEALGVVQQRNRKPDYYQRSRQQTQQRLGQ